jgi:Acetyl/propionyl-CoA carboxylase, alpha subunit
MKNYRITVNGNVYDVTVEEAGSAPMTSAPSAPVAVPKAAPAPKAAPTASGSQGAVKINAPMPGKVLSVKASVGAAVTKGQVIMILEAMKMENEIVAPQDGTIASIDVSEGASVEAGTVLASLN